MGRERFDIYMNQARNNLSAYLEFKMYYRNAEEEYLKDFRKLHQIVTMAGDAVALLVHFNLYNNRNRPNHIAIDNAQSGLDPSRYGSDASTIGGNEFHFYRLAFWRT